MREDPEVTFRRERAEELEQLAEILVREDFCGDSSPLYAAAAQCRTDTPRTADSWSYTLAPLVFRGLGTPHQLRPRDVADISHTLTVELAGTCVADGHLGDPFTSLAVELLTKATLHKRALYCAWHLDRHLVQDGDGLPGEVHPLYHFQYGGETILGMFDREEAEFGDVLLFDPPRLAHPPMDAVLAIDFVLSNYAYARRNNLYDDPRYRDLIVAAQRRFWKPYALATWHGSDERVLHHSWRLCHPWPQLYGS